MKPTRKKERKVKATKTPKQSKTMRKLICSRCGYSPYSCDGGYGDKFKLGQSIFCKKFPKRKGAYGGAKSLHYCSQEEMDEMILETASGEADYCFRLRSYGKPATITYELPARTRAPKHEEQ